VDSERRSIGASQRHDSKEDDLDVNLNLLDDITWPVIAQDGLPRPGVECPSIESPQEGGSFAGELDLGHHTSVA
jgi:hypothetical protein